MNEEPEYTVGFAIGLVFNLAIPSDAPAESIQRSGVEEVRKLVEATVNARLVPDLKTLGWAVDGSYVDAHLVLPGEWGDE